MHATRNICFTLDVDDFTIKYVKKEDADHLLTALQKDYTVSTDWEASVVQLTSVDTPSSLSSCLNSNSKKSAAMQTSERQKKKA